MHRVVVAALVCCELGCSGPGAATGGECHGLSLEACRVTDGCKPDECAGCGCDITYRGCLATVDEPLSCPALGCPSEDSCCSAATTCATSAGECAPPGSPQGCGFCSPDPSTCAADADCKAAGAAMICDPIPCSCDGNSACVQGCTDDTTCDEGTTCDVASARCMPTACTGDAACPSNFHCAADACARTTCTDDLACDGYCVDGACYAQRGECRLPVP